MRAIKAQNILVILLFIIIAGSVGVMILRPDLVPIESFKKGVEVIQESLSGKKASEIAEKDKKISAKNGSGENKPPVKKDIYLLELKSGGRVYTDNLKTSGGKMTYTTPQGLIISINGHEILSVKKFKEGEEPAN